MIYRITTRGQKYIQTCGVTDSLEGHQPKNMSFKLPVLSSVKVSLRSTAGLPEFQWSDLSENDEIGRGAFGSVLIACHGTATEKVVIKKLVCSSRADEKQKFFKEARLLKKLRHKNVV